ncbi:ClpXP protease specificity-enhancing factor [Aliikangiella sp. IMCC44359]|uniref:ClpXP protease specificity-enhancing factor n=1 Tax=Aliikangiella sp. IMCC44359 TaxID=3459125 RepID=UPI00403AF81D
MQKAEFSSNKPYLFRAIFDWLLDNEAVPYVLVDTTKQFVDVPQEHIKDGQIVLNVAPSAVQNWHADNEAISFSARFGGVARQIYVPMNALMAVYDQENGLGMAFPAQEHEEDTINSQTEAQADILEEEEKVTSVKKNGHLKIVK